MDNLNAASHFDDAASYYDRFRAPYAPAALEHIASVFRLTDGVRVLDLGCGPGRVAIPLSRFGAEVVAVDPNERMLEQGHLLALERSAGNISWMRGRAEDLLSELGRFRLATFGQSLHWMDRDFVLRVLGKTIEDGGGIAILDEGRRRPQETWESVVTPIIGKYVTRTGRHPSKHPESDHEPSLRRSAHFSDFMVREFGFEFTRDFASVLGCIYSGVSVSKALLGNRVAAFEAELLEALAVINPSRVFREKIETAVFIAMKK